MVRAFGALPTTDWSYAPVLKATLRRPRCGLSQRLTCSGTAARASNRGSGNASKDAIHVVPGPAARTKASTVKAYPAAVLRTRTVLRHAMIS